MIEMINGLNPSQYEPILDYMDSMDVKTKDKYYKWIPYIMKKSTFIFNYNIYFTQKRKQ
jgi:hypothetical protein